MRVMRLANAFFAFLFSTAPGGDDWPQWRGPNRDGLSRETDLLSSWAAWGSHGRWGAGLRSRRKRRSRLCGGSDGQGRLARESAFAVLGGEHRLGGAGNAPGGFVLAPG